MFWGRLLHNSNRLMVNLCLIDYRQLSLVKYVFEGRENLTLAGVLAGWVTRQVTADSPTKDG